MHEIDCPDCRFLKSISHSVVESIFIFFIRNKHMSSLLVSYMVVYQEKYMQEYNRLRLRYIFSYISQYGVVLFTVSKSL